MTLTRATTEDAENMWRKVDAAGERAPEWIKERIKELTMAYHGEKKTLWYLDEKKHKVTSVDATMDGDVWVFWYNNSNMRRMVRTENMYSDLYDTQEEATIRLRRMLMDEISELQEKLDLLNLKARQGANNV